MKDDIVIDLASFYKSSLGPKIKLLRQAISSRTIVSLEYYSKNGQTKRKLEPYFITFKWSAWYVFGFCLLRQDFRLFKLNRLIKLELTDNENFKNIDSICGDKGFMFNIHCPKDAVTGEGDKSAVASLKVVKII